MKADAIDAIKGLVEQASALKEVNGEQYSTVQLHRVKHNPSIKALTITTLTGLVDYIKSDVDKSVWGKTIIVVDGPGNVSMRSVADEKELTRDTFVEVRAHEGNSFNFGQYMDSEEFIIKVKSMFSQTPDLTILLSFISKISVKNSLETQDDGVSQAVAVNRGMSGALQDRAIAPSIVGLAPYRTFREITQPTSQFLFRMKAGHDTSKPTCALFEADGGTWRNAAVLSIKEYLTGKLEGATIIA